MTAAVVNLLLNPASMIVYMLGHLSSITYVLYSLGFEFTKLVL